MITIENVKKSTATTEIEALKQRVAALEAARCELNEAEVKRLVSESITPFNAFS